MTEKLDPKWTPKTLESVANEILENVENGVDTSALRKLEHTDIIRWAAAEIERLSARLAVASDPRHVTICEEGHPVEVPCELQDEVERLRADKDEAYRQRNVLVAAMSRLFPSGVRDTDIEGWSPKWHGCVYLDLPSGQASYHFHESQAYLFSGLPRYTKPYDGHGKEDAERRVLDAARGGEDE